MDNASLVIGLVLTLVCALPLFYIANKQAKNRKKVKEIFNSFAQGKYNFSIKETHYKKIYAIDKEKKGFLFVDLDKENERANFVDLNEITSCKVEEISAGESSRIVIIFKAGAKEIKEIVLYDLATDRLGNAYWLENEQFAKKWQTVIENSI
jgi:hypothetical protein